MYAYILIVLSFSFFLISCSQEGTDLGENPQKNIKSQETKKDSFSGDSSMKVSQSSGNQDTKEVIEPEINLEENENYSASGNILTIKGENIRILLQDQFSIMDQYVGFGPLDMIPESPTDKIYKGFLYFLSVRQARDISKIQEEYDITKKQGDDYVGGFEQIESGGFIMAYWEEPGMCAGRKFEILGKSKNIIIESSGCSASSSYEADMKYIKELLSNSTY